mmetsp:Transcript_30175/g.56094  ORF Transcript_30175/g.56094 Transcript_30175/m.56094 type:complete len:356 (-) Transcript_30175:137-1204(-)
MLQQEVELDLPSWLLGVDALSDNESDDEGEGQDGGEGGPDLTLDAEGVLTLLNHSDVARTYFVTVENCAHVYSAEDLDLLDDRETGKRFPYLTFVVMLHPHTCADVATLVPKKTKTKKKKGKVKGGERDLSSIQITSDVQEYVSTPSGTIDTTSSNSNTGGGGGETRPFHMDVFPLAITADTFSGETPRPEDKDKGKDEGSWLCTQSSGGHLTHFAHPSTFHAVDFRCAVGTPVLALFSGRVLEVRHQSCATGPHASNLFSWNSILLQRVSECQEDGGGEGEDLFAEYVHIHHEGVAVAEGQMVRRGQLLCLSGEAGFCPEPHLHLQVTRSRDVAAPSVPIYFEGKLIAAGCSYP